MFRILKAGQYLKPRSHTSHQVRPLSTTKTSNSKDGSSGPNFGPSATEQKSLPAYGIGAAVVAASVYLWNNSDNYKNQGKAVPVQMYETPFKISTQEAVEEELDTSDDGIKIYQEPEPEPVAEVAVQEPVQQVAEVQPEPVEQAAEPVAEVTEPVAEVAEPVSEPEVTHEVVEEPAPLGSVQDHIEKAKEIVDEVKEAVQEVTEIINEVKEIENLVQDDLKKVEDIAETAKDTVNQVIDDAAGAVKEAVVVAKEVEQVVEKAVEVVENVAPVAEQVVEEVVEKAVEVVAEVAPKVEQVVEQVAEAAAPVVGEVVEIAAEKVAEVVKKVEEKVEQVVAEPVAKPVAEVAEPATESSQKVEENESATPEKTMFEQELEKAESETKEPVEIDPNALPEHVPYVLIGGGAATFAAIRSITARDPGCKILVLTDEEHGPYQRPPLSKELWFGNTEESSNTLAYTAWNKKVRSIYMDAEFDYAKPGELMHYEGTKVALATGCKVNRISPYEDKVVLEDGREVGFDKCLIATGGQPRKMIELESIDQNKVTYYRKISDFQKLELQTRTEFIGKKVAVIGGGFLGSEISVALATQAEKFDYKVTQVVKESGNLGAVLPDYLSQWSTKKVEKCGVEVLTNSKIESAVENENGSIDLTLNNGEVLNVDHVIAAVGIEVDQSFAERSGIEFDQKRGGFVVNSELQAKSNIWGAGDATSFHDIKLGRRRVEHHDHAVVSGRLAGQNMTGAKKPFWHQSMFWSDLGPEVGFEAIGLVDSKRYRTVGFYGKAEEENTPENRDRALAGLRNARINREKAQPKQDFGKGVIFYVNKKNVVVGCVTWNIFGKMKTARKIIGEQKPMTQEELISLAKLFKIDNKKEAVAQ